MKLTFSILFLFITISLFSQNDFKNQISKELNERSEVYISYNIEYVFSHKNEFEQLSFDKIENNRIYFYASKKDLNSITRNNRTLNLEPIPSKLNSILMASSVSSLIFSWDKYPTYQQYDSLMHKFEQDYPNLCKFQTLGTLPSGREILAVKLGDSVNINQNEVKFLYTSTMHGDETTGYLLMLRMIDYLLSNYNTNTYVKYLMDNVEIWINPLANPDGTYHTNDNTVFGATRYNANAVDLNRNYPDPEDGPHPDGKSYQPETIIFMNFADSVQFSMSANLHGGKEVANYPWDTWATLSADDIWWQKVAKSFADTAQANSPSGYFDLFGTGYTNGYQWYSVWGGRQDYMNYFKHCREITLELSDQKTIPENQLNTFWDYLYPSFLNYINESTYGIKGQTTDSMTGFAVKSKIEILNHDVDSSLVYSNDSGYYFRPIFDGNYDINFSANGYASKTITNYQIHADSLVVLNVKLSPSTIGIKENSKTLNISLFPNPLFGSVVSIKSDEIINNVEVFDVIGNILFYSTDINSIEYSIELKDYPKGIYLIIIHSGEMNVIRKLLIQ